MTDSNDFLKFLINENIYLIDEKGEAEAQAVDPKDTTSYSDDSQEAQANEPEPVLEKPIPSNDILIIFDNPSEPELAVGDKEYLDKILGAIGKSIAIVDFLNVAVTNPEINGYKQVIAFTPNHKLPIAVSTMQYAATTMDGIEIIVADSLINISGSTDLRKKLWGVLQQVFKS
ncbi:MAG: hypothetical protein ABJF11_18835 [Reichenbachiella sp.]|uniref:hypothetical protein n=1 Tax=Reichenbachiella sp. TaxID=2184521 RepID=UPI00326419AF